MAVVKSLRTLIPIGVAIASFLASIGVAHAACVGGGYDREVVAQVPDVTFVAGVPETKTLNPVYSVRLSNDSFYDCGAIARSNTSGVNLIESYGIPGTVHRPGEWGGVGVSAGPGTFRYGSGFQIVYDGSGTAGTRGTIEIAQKQSEFDLSPRVIATVNVYIVPPGSIPATWLTVTSSAQTISGDRLILDHPFLNGQPSAIAFVSHVWNPGGTSSGVFWNHPISMAYDSTLGKWAIQNDDSATMVAGLSFNVRIDPSGARITVRGKRDQQVKFVKIDQPTANYNPFATVMVTPAGGTRNPHPIAVKYVVPYWGIVNSDGANIPVGAAFNVKVMGASSYIDDTYRGARPFDPLGSNAWSDGVGIDIVGIGANRTAFANRYLSFFWSPGKPALPLIVTPNENPLGKSVVADPHYVGVFYTGTGRADPPGRWSVYHEDQTAMPTNARFNVWAPATGEPLPVQEPPHPHRP